LPTGGLLLVVASGGKGKTTFSIDGVFHMASGLAFVGIPVLRPLRILIIENEGPREPFRRKLERKSQAWTDQVAGAIFVKTLNWGDCMLDDSEERKRLRAFIEQEHIDLVVGDPLDSMGLEGVGSPKDTREFMKLLVKLGLTRDVAFWMLHHTNKQSWDDELEEASGAWGGRPDTMLRLNILPGNRSRLSFPKIRWGSEAQRAAWILDFDKNTETFSKVGDEAVSERDYFVDVSNLLQDRVWRTSREIAAPSNPRDGSKPGIGASETAIKAALEERPDFFISKPGNEVGRHPNATCWSVRQGGNADDTDDTDTRDKGVSVRLRSALRESRTHDTDITPVSQTATQTSQTGAFSNLDQEGQEIKAASEARKNRRVFK
jgi:AAA domain